LYIGHRDAQELATIDGARVRSSGCCAFEDRSFMVVNYRRKHRFACLSLSLLFAAVSGQAIAQTVGNDDPNWRLSEPNVAAVVDLDSLGGTQSDNQLLESGIELAGKGFLKEASEKFRLVLKRDPDNAQARNNLATCLKRQGQLAQAIEEYKRAVDANPQVAEVHNNLGLAYMAENDFKQALPEFYQAIKYKSDYAQAYYNLAELLAKTNNFEGAVENYQQALKLSDVASYHRAFASVLDKLGRNEQALVEYLAATKDGDHAESTYLGLGKAQEKTQAFNEAKDSFKQVLALDAVNCEALNELGFVEGKLGNNEQAKLYLNKALSIDAGYVQARVNLGSILFAQKQYLQAVSLWRQAVLLKPDLAEAHYNLGMALLQCGLVKQADEALRKCLTLSPDNANFHNNLGVVLMREGNLNEARREWRQAIKLNPDLSEASLNLDKWQAIVRASKS
jgi:Flp pilus assembly protein TadD